MQSLASYELERPYRVAKRRIVAINIQRQLNNYHKAIMGFLTSIHRLNIAIGRCMPALF
jgi:hypothetical protein